MSEYTDMLKKVMELTGEALMWKQRAHDMEQERNYLRGLLEQKLLGDKRVIPVLQEVSHPGVFPDGS